ncbi:acyltransferase [Streptomyces sp. XM4193]|uniref:acyltransferase n=1 Tax=Streptomyces sp. XM4193 TaxID=2929782 RepID=UPI001FFAF97B|nr:acyltransferase [Streptomyces sp. XM4193]MCK1796887.1 acyltransferase [Streptomyces sp. XM4193]
MPNKQAVTGTEPGTAPAAAAPDTRPDAPADTRAPAPPRRREHRVDIDLMRLICSCAVMLGHVGATFIRAVDRQVENGAGAYWVGHIADSANEFAVPMYFAMAGWAVLAGAPPRDGRAARQRLVRNGLPLLAWTAIYLLWAWLRSRNDEPMTELAFTSLFGSVQPAYHLWFMYVYLPLVAVLAFVVLLRAGQRPWLLGALLAAVAVAPAAMETAEKVTGWDGPPVSWGFGTYSLVYAVLGALLFALPKGVPDRHRWLLVPGFLAAFAGCLWYNTQVHYVIPNAHLFVAALTGSMLLLVNRVRVPERFRPRVSQLAGAALGAYMVHVIVVEELVVPRVSADLGAPAAAVLLPVLWLATIALSYAASLLWGRLGLRKLLG